MNYEELMIEADANNVEVIELPLKAHSGLILDTTIAIRQDIPITKKACVLAEELGHYHTTVGDILDQTDVSNRKQERTARLWAYNKQIGLSGLVHCLEAFLQDALECYRQKYGICTSYQQYTIYFEPKLAICKKLA